jgi:tripartite-type tricarboxylate transporter receptor subunit TctC
MRGWIACAAALALAGSAAAQSWPAKTVKIVVPYPAGSGPDIVGRILAEEFRRELGQPFVVDNKAGALGTIGTAEVARAAPDGYTILLTTNTPQAANVALFKKLTYDPVKDFAPIARVITSNMVLLVRRDFPAATIQGFLAEARKRSGTITAAYATAGSQVSIATLETKGGFKSVLVPYKGIPPAVQDVVSGEVNYTFADLAVGMAQIHGGTVRGLGVTSIGRTPIAPEIPALAEELPGFEVTLWYGLVAPAGTSRPVVDKLYDATHRALEREEVRARLAAAGLDPAPMTPDAFASYIVSEIEKWGVAAKAAGIEPQ